MTLRTPLTPDVKSRPYLTIIPNRIPQQKTHTSLGNAKNAISYKVERNGTQWDMAVYEWVDGEWSLLWDIPEGTKEHELPWRK
jgi:hypothetical protein